MDTKVSFKGDIKGWVNLLDFHIKVFKQISEVNTSSFNNSINISRQNMPLTINELSCRLESNEDLIVSELLGMNSLETDEKVYFDYVLSKIKKIILYTYVNKSLDFRLSLIEQFETKCKYFYDYLDVFLDD